MSVRTDSGAAELLLPLATGLLMLGINAVVPVGGAGLLGLLLLLTLGAVLPGNPWRTGALAAAPMVVAAVVAAAGESLGAAALFLVAAPILLAVCAAAVKAGAMLVAPAAEAKAGEGRRGPFETQAQRGRFLVVVAVLLVIGASYCRNLGASEADRAAERTVEELRGVLAGQPAESLRLASLGSGLAGVGVVPGGPYRSVRPGSDRFTATTEVTKLAQSRCIRVEVDAAGAVTTKVVKRACS
jgi:hypothetical protein